MSSCRWLAHSTLDNEPTFRWISDCKNDITSLSNIDCVRLRLWDPIVGRLLARFCAIHSPVLATCA
jgi:hypothetical protein